MEHVDVMVIGGGQSGLAAAHALRNQGLAPVILEASGQPTGSWPRYYDSLTLFSPGAAAPCRVCRSAVPRPIGRLWNLRPASPTRPPRVGRLHGHRAARGRVLRAGTTRRAGGLPGRRLGEGGGRRGRQLGGADRRRAGHTRPGDARGAASGAVRPAAPAGPGPAPVATADRARRPAGGQVPAHAADTAGDRRRRYRTAVAAGAPDLRPVFSAIDGTKATWTDGTTEEIDTIVLATGCRPDLGCLRPLGALDGDGHPRHREGLSTTHPGLAYVGLEWQRSLSSNSLRGGRQGRRPRRTAPCRPSRRPLTLTGLVRHVST